MADNNRRNRPSSGYGSNDNFNWEEYDMKTSSASGAPRRRRQAASTKPTRSPQASSSSYREVPSRRRTQTTSRSKKKAKKAAYSETDSIQETLTAYILCCDFCGSCNCIRYGHRNVCRSIT